MADEKPTYQLLGTIGPEPHYVTVRGTEDPAARLNRATIAAAAALEQLRKEADQTTEAMRRFRETMPTGQWVVDTEAPADMSLYTKCKRCGGDWLKGKRCPCHSSADLDRELIEAEERVLAEERRLSNDLRVLDEDRRKWAAEHGITTKSEPEVES